LIVREEDSPIKLILRLQEARTGEPQRLESIKKTLNSGREIAEHDMKYLQQLSSKLYAGFEHQRMVDWAMGFVRKLQEKENRTSLTLDELKTSLEKERETYKIDQKLLEDTSITLKQAVEQEKKISTTIQLISQLKGAKIGDTNKLDKITGLLKSGKTVNDSDRQYLMDKERAFKKLVEYKAKVTWSLDAIKKLQEAEIRHSTKLEAIKQALEQRSPISTQETAYLNAHYEKLQRVLDEQKRIEWTKHIIEKLRQLGRGDAAKFDAIKQLLEEEIPIPESDLKYLKEQYEGLRQTLDHARQLEWSIHLIDDLLDNDVGNAQRLVTIRKSIEERKVLSESDITYLRHKYRALEVITKNLEKDNQIDNQKEKNQKMEINYNSVLNELNGAIIKSERLQSTGQT